MNDAEYQKQRFLCESWHIFYVAYERATEVTEEKHQDDGEWMYAERVRAQHASSKRNVLFYLLL